MVAIGAAPLRPIHDEFPCLSCKVRDRSLCAALETHELSKLDAIASEVDLQAGDPIFFEEDENNYVFNITDGVVQLSRLLPDGRRQITGFLFPGDFLGLSKEGGYANTAEAVTATKLCRFPRTHLLKMFEELPKLEAQLLNQRSNELVEAQEHIMLLGRKSASERVATLLLMFAKKASGSANPATELHLPVTREAMADYLGMRLETVSRVLSDLRKRGLIDLPSPHRIRFLQWDSLNAIASGLERD